ncbi:MAG: IS1380 family transposase [Actinobacteria bacterium]|nr:IS1380 family transposase [Actinomycetota bacterium]
MHVKSSRKKGKGQLAIKFTDKPITPYGGMAFMADYFNRVGLGTLFEDALPDRRTSPNAIPVTDICLSFITSVLCGAQRFAHVLRIQNDRALGEVMGVRRIPSASTLTRYFGAFTHGDVERMSEKLSNWTFEHISREESGHTLDLDSSVFTRYGNQEGARKGYNPKKPGRPSHRPIFAVLFESRIIANLWLRSGDTSDLTGIEQFMDETLGRIPDGVNIERIRADSGFHSERAYSYFEERGLYYAVYVRMDPRIQRKIASVSDWLPVDGDPSREVADISYRALKWKKARRMVIIRERVQEGKDNRGKKLFEIPDYTYSAVFTNMTEDPVEVWRFYNGRADIENRIKELRYDFGADGFCLNSFYGTEAALRIIALLFNLMTMFKETVMGTTRPTLKTIRYQVIVTGAQLGSSGRKKILRNQVPTIGFTFELH